MYFPNEIFYYVILQGKGFVPYICFCIPLATVYIVFICEKTQYNVHRFVFWYNLIVFNIRYDYELNLCWIIYSKLLVDKAKGW